MRDERFFRVIVVGGLSLVGSSACGKDAPNRGVPNAGSADAAEGLSTEAVDAAEEITTELPSRSEGGGSDLVNAEVDATVGVDASSLRDAELAADVGLATADAGGCTFMSFPSETAIALCVGRCAPSGCVCAVPAQCTCEDCADTGVTNSGDP
jgi:hypothetical protein